MRISLFTLWSCYLPKYICPFLPIKPQFAIIIKTLYFVLFYVIWFLEISLVVTSVTGASERCDFNKNDVSGTWIVIRPKQIYVCLLLHVKKIYGRSGIIFFFLLLSAKPERVVPGSRIWFRYFIFEISGKMTNYAVCLPSLLSISTKS